VYARVAVGHPRSINNNGAGAGSPTALVRLDAASLTETGRLPLDTSRNRDINLSPDGKLLLIATGVTSKGVIVIDLTRFEIKARILSGFRPSSATFSPNGVQIAVVGEQIALYNTADLVRTAEYVTPGSTSKVVRATYSDPNTLWIGRRSDTAVIDLRTGTSTPYPTLAGRMLEVYDGKIYTGNFSQVHEVDNTGAILKTFDLGNLASHWLGLSPF
jgi:DNA-binding beta-propeller fold protein YncE